MNAPQRALPKVKNSENRDLQKVPPLLPAHKTFLQPSRLYCYTSSRHYIKLKSDISRQFIHPAFRHQSSLKRKTPTTLSTSY
jgi:hypothetical protein